MLSDVSDAESVQKLVMLALEVWASRPRRAEECAFGVMTPL